MTKYHAHITIPVGLLQSIVNISGWKKTEIVLNYSDKESTDVMFTKYFVLGHRGFEYAEDIIDYISIFAKSIGAIRYKIEQDNNFDRPITQEQYVEIHAKVRVPKDKPINEYPNWVRSRNPKDENNTHYEFFYNTRLYEGAHMFSPGLRIAELIDKLAEHEEYIESHIEHILIDSNINHDKEWTDGK